MKKILYIDRDQRLSGLEETIKKRPDLGISLEHKTEIVKEDSPIFQTMTSTPPGNWIMASEHKLHFIDNCSEYGLIILHMNNIGAKDFYLDKLLALPVIIMTGGPEKMPNWLSKNISNVQTFIRLQDIQDRFIEFIERWKELKFSLEKAPYTIFTDSRAYSHFISLDILIQGYLTIHSAANGKPWEWINNKETAEGLPDMLIQKMATQRLNEIESDPYKWFESAVDSLKEIFPPDNPYSSIKLERALANMPDAQKELLIPSELVRLSKFIVAVYSLRKLRNGHKKCFDSKVIWKEYIQDDFLLKAHEKYKGLAMNIEEKILDEFLNFRSYVSHTLCKNRFFLYVSVKNIKVLNEPNVWPILKAEIESLFELGPTLYGIKCPSVFEKDKKEIEAAISKIEALKKSTEWTDDLVANADSIKNILENMRSKFLKTTDFKIDLNILKTYTKKSSESLKKTITQFISKEIIPLLGDSNKLGNKPDDGKLYWELYPEIMKLIRECIVQAIVEGQDEQFISEMKDIMQAFMYPDKNLVKLNKYGIPATT